MKKEKEKKKCLLIKNKNDGSTHIKHEVHSILYKLDLFKTWNETENEIRLLNHILRLRESRKIPKLGNISFM